MTDLSSSFHPYSREQQVGKKKPKEKAQDRAVYQAATEAARDPKSGFLICALCGEPGADDEMHRDHIKTRGSGGKTTLDNIRICHATCHMNSHLSGKREKHKR